VPKVLEDIEIGDVSPTDLIDAARARGIFVFDLETTGTDVHQDRIEGIAFYVPPHGEMPELRAWYPFVPGTMRTHVQPDESAEEQAARLKYDRTGHKADRLAWEKIQQPPVIAELRDAMDQAALVEALRPLFENSPNTVCIAHNIKFDVAFMRHQSGCEVGYFHPFKLDENVIFADSMLADFLCDENHYAYGLKGRVKTLFDHDMTTYKDIMRNRRQLTFSWVADEIKADSLGHYAMEDCYWTWRLFEHAMKKLDELTPGTPLIGMEDDVDEKDISPFNRCRTKGLLERIYWGIDMKIALVLEEMESTGILIDWRHLKTVTSDLNKKKEEILDKIEQQIGRTLNPNSAPQVSTLLFANPPTGLALPSKGVKRGKSGQISTGSKEIQHLRRVNPVVTDILDWRSADTVIANFSAKLAGLSIADENNRIYSHFNQTGTKIYRLSCIAGSSKLSIRLGDEDHRRSIRISELELGERDVWIETHKGRERRITHLINKGPGVMFAVETETGSTIRCTKDHRFLAECGWRALKNIQVGDRLVRAGNVTAITPVGIEPVWDITVEEDASYVAQGFVNHNSSNPVNLQNQPRDRNLIRKAFCSHLADDHERAHLMLFGCDYSQVELRVAAYLSGDKGMIEVYANEGPCSKGSDGTPCKRYRQWVCDSKLPNGDYCGHLWTPPDASDPETRACPKCGGREIEHQKRCRHVDLHQRTSEDVGVPRNPLAKNANFGLLYRMAAPRFSQYADLYDDKGNARIDYARDLIKKWFEAYPGIEPFQAQVEAKLKSNGWVAETLTGRQRRLAKERYKNEYRAVTQGIQFAVSGTAQDILKVAMFRIWEEKNRLVANSSPALRKLWEQFRMIIQVHDEIMFEGPIQIRDEIVELMTTRMESAAELRRPGPRGSTIYVPLKTEVKVGRCWDDCH
jgi:DNA polymerase I-like protein with 3'-5' exonuclease and polymerase domains